MTLSESALDALLLVIFGISCFVTGLYVGGKWLRDMYEKEGWRPPE